MAEAIFKDPALQEAFDRDGFVHVPLLEPEDVEELRGLYFHYFPDPPPNFFSSSYLDDYNLKKEISDRVAAIIGKRLDRYFKDYNCFGSAFLSKGPGQRGEMPMHQDWTIVDEKQFVAVNIWTPMQDANRENGGLQMLKGSHAFAPVVRAPTLPFFFEGHEALILPHLTALDVKATEAVILNQAVVHYSPANMTDSTRLAITTGLKNAAAPMRFFYKSGEDKLEQFAMPEDFLLMWKDFHSSIFKRPVFGESLGEVDYVHEVPGEAQLREWLGADAPEGEKQGFWGKLKAVFGA